MGFHLVKKVYFNVTGTSPAAQSVLAYLAYRADDKGIRKCFPSYLNIVSATHIPRSTVAEALNSLRDANLLTWKSGGRQKGGGGRSLANEYVLNLPESRVRKPDSEASASRTVQRPQPESCVVQQPDTISKYNHPLSQPSVIGTPEADTDVVKQAIIQVAESWSAVPERIRVKVDEERARDQQSRRTLIDEAMRVTSCPCHDVKNRQIFSSTIIRRDQDRVAEEIYRFERECRAGEHKNLSNPAALLNSRLAQLPIVN